MRSLAATYNMDSVNSHLGMLVFPITFLTESLAPEMYYLHIYFCSLLPIAYSTDRHGRSDIKQYGKYGIKNTDCVDLAQRLFATGLMLAGSH